MFSFPFARLWLELLPIEPGKPLRYRTMRLTLECDGAGNGQFDLSAGADPASELQSSADAFGTFAHAG